MNQLTPEKVALIRELFGSDNGKFQVSIADSEIIITGRPLLTDSAVFFSTVHGSAAPENKQLYDIVYELSEMFDDMLFEPGSSTYGFIVSQSQGKHGQWEETDDLRPDLLRCFCLDWFGYVVKDLGSYDGCYSPMEQILCVSPQALEKREIILHEMIHLYLRVLDELPKYYHDILLWSLYKALKNKIEKLDELITDFLHVINENALYSYGGLHGLSFLLKSLDLDNRLGYSFGTVMGYEYAKRFAKILSQ